MILNRRCIDAAAAKPGGTRVANNERIIIHMSNTTNTTCNCNTCIWKADCGNNTWMIEDGVYDERFHCPDYSPVEGEIDVEQDCELDLIEPQVMSDVCAKILENSDVDEVDMRHRIEWFKKLSDDGYYLSYDLNL